jgi:hypothetical protein
VAVTQFFEEFYQCRTVPVEKTEDPLIVSTDTKGIKIKMRKEALRPATRKAADKKEGRYVVRLASGEKSNSKRKLVAVFENGFRNSVGRVWLARLICLPFWRA